MSKLSKNWSIGKLGQLQECILVHPLLSEAGLIPAKILLDSCQKKYAYRLLTLPDYHPAKNTLPVSMREGDGNSQPGEQPENTLMW